MEVYTTPKYYELIEQLEADVAREKRQIQLKYKKQNLPKPKYQATNIADNKTVQEYVKQYHDFVKYLDSNVKTDKFDQILQQIEDDKQYDVDTLLERHINEQLSKSNWRKQPTQKQQNQSQINKNVSNISVLGNKYQNISVLSCQQSNKIEGQPQDISISELKVSRNAPNLASSQIIYQQMIQNNSQEEKNTTVLHNQSFKQQSYQQNTVQFSQLDQDQDEQQQQQQNQNIMAETKPQVELEEENSQESITLLDENIQKRLNQTNELLQSGENLLRKSQSLIQPEIDDYQSRYKEDMKAEILSNINTYQQYNPIKNEILSQTMSCKIPIQNKKSIKPVNTVLLSQSYQNRTKSQNQTQKPEQNQQMSKVQMTSYSQNILKQSQQQKQLNKTKIEQKRQYNEGISQRYEEYMRRQMQY